MSQLTDTARWISPPRVRGRWIAVLMALAIALTGAAVLAAMGDRPIDGSAEAAGLEPGGRADDFGLRHPATIGIEPTGRADDFGLRHPATIGIEPTGRADDFGLRHPATSSVQPGGREDDYGLRHPNP